jgi:6-phosphofructokinase 2
MIATVTLNPSLDEWMRLPTLRVGRLNRATGFARYPGGKGINVSRVIRELGGQTRAFALAGGEDGLILRKLMSRLSIPYDCVAVSGSTRNNYKIRTAFPRTLTEVNTAGPPASTTVLKTLKQRLLGHTPPPQCVVLSGSLPPGVIASTYRRWIHALRGRGIPSVLDASGAALRQGLSGRPWLIKPNRQEAEDLLQRRLISMDALVKAAVYLLQRGPALVILSLGRDGALLACGSPQEVWLARPPSVKVDSAVGAGDSLVGGFLVGWFKYRSLLEAFRLGVASGTATAMTPGTELCHRADVRRLLRRVTIRRIA